MTDKVVVITGGSRGIGRATALAAAARGFRVVVGYASNEAAANEVVRPDHLTWVIVGDLKKIEAPVRALNLGKVQVLDADGKPVK